MPVRLWIWTECLYAALCVTALTTHWHGPGPLVAYGVLILPSMFLIDLALLWNRVRTLPWVSVQALVLAGAFLICAWSYQNAPPPKPDIEPSVIVRP